MSDIGYLPSESRNRHKRPYRHAYGVPLPPLRRGKLIVACPVFHARKKRAVVSRPLFEESAALVCGWIPPLIYL